MSTINFDMYVSYSQICVFESGLENPFNDWSDRAYSQGFAWRRHSVSFRALVEDGTHRVNLYINESIPQSLPSSCVRALRVPFEMHGNAFDVASITDCKGFELESGMYVVQIELLMPEPGPEVNIRINTGSGNFGVLRADDLITDSGEFDMSASPAV